MEQGGNRVEVTILDGGAERGRPCHGTSVTWRRQQPSGGGGHRE
jgi:hypothetical protein